MRIVRAEVEINFKEGKQTISMLLKQPHEMEDCKKGKVVILNINDGEQATGIFKGVDDNDVIELGALSGTGACGWAMRSVKDYFEQV